MTRVFPIFIFGFLFSGCQMPENFDEVILTCENTLEVVPASDFELANLGTMLDNLEWTKATDAPPCAPDWKISAVRGSESFEAFVYSGQVIYWPEQKMSSVIEWGIVEKELYAAAGLRWANHFWHPIESNQ